MGGRTAATHLEVEMGDSLGVHVLQPAEDLLDEEGGLCFAESLLFGDELKELSTANPAKQNTEMNSNTALPRTVRNKCQNVSASVL